MFVADFAILIFILEIKKSPHLKHKLVMYM